MFVVNIRLSDTAGSIAAADPVLLVFASESVSGPASSPAGPGESVYFAAGHLSVPGVGDAAQSGRAGATGPGGCAI